jgi:hypothetical protein
MAYVPQNVLAFQAAFAGAVAGCLSDGRATVSAPVDDPAVVPQLAACFAFAQQLDTVRGAVIPSTFAANAILQMSQGFWLSRAGGASAEPTDYTAAVTALLNNIQSAANYLATH